MILYDWIVNNLLRVFLPDSALEFILFYVKNPNQNGISHAVTVADAIGTLFSLAVGFCAVYILVWVPFRGILHILNWKRWRGY